MELTYPNDLDVVYNKDGIKGSSLTKTDNFEIIYMTLEPGAHLAKHKTPFDAEFFTHKGRAVYIIEDREFNSDEGSIIVCPGEIEHGIRNDSNEQIIVLVIKKFKQ
jgi:quercetin dioxygenase-like cupin family protein